MSNQPDNNIDAPTHPTDATAKEPLLGSVNVRTGGRVGGSRSIELGEPQTIVLPQGRIQYRERGQGPVLLFVHGLYVNADLWRKVVPQLCARYRCIVVDWPLGAHAYPMAATADLTPTGIADLIADVITTLGLSDVTVIANDTGIAYTQVFVANHPDKLARLVLTPGDVIWNFLPVPIKWMRPLSQLPGGINVIARFWNSGLGRSLIMTPLTKTRPAEAVLDSWFRPATQDQELRRDLVKLLRAARPRAAITAARQLHRFTGPALIAWSASGNVIFPRRHAHLLRKLLADAQLDLIPRTRAFISEDQPELLAEAIDQFVKTKPLS
ncbi:alpha/beta hydrolase [Mycobacterium sp. 852013-50091_SCH5140682]|uniref:alpha/beta fold hydrolase n=1 Tax=Mycobacterium sp. 852013-50091_SCH5140682 TaxID=1834109 RepID=UPI0018D400B5|nr:alpha/beta hydrolase [Mycobacterium sp. 852013-50091_SCH5140682]